MTRPAPKSPLPLGPKPADRGCPGCRAPVGHDDVCCPSCFGRLPAELRDPLTVRRPNPTRRALARTRAVQWLAGHQVPPRR